MKHPPGVHDIEVPERGQVGGVEDGSLLDRPAGAWREPAAQLTRGRHRIRIEVKGVYVRPEPVGGQREQPATAPDVQKCPARQLRDAQRLDQGAASRLDSGVVNEFHE